VPEAGLPYEPHGGGLRVRVRLTPRGGRDAIEGIEVLGDGRVVLKARVRAAPEKGLANAALEALLAKALRVPRSAVAVVVGGTSRVKVVEVSGKPIDLIAAIRPLLGS
jgi:uncharacterized protein YggU (UPF0235/DUF167 family)